MNLKNPAITHFPSPIKGQSLSKEEQRATIAYHFRAIMETLGLDLTDPSLEQTPERVAKMYVNEVFAGLDPANFPHIRFFPDQLHHEHKANIVCVKVAFTSFCEHHFVPMHGYVHVAYLPRGQLLGLSKIPRLVRYFAKRPQLQERFTAQIADSLAQLLSHEDVAVSVMATHFCVIARGVEDESSHATTNVLRGAFHEDPHLRKEFFEAINRK